MTAAGTADPARTVSTVSEALESRKSTRAFLDRPVARPRLEEIARRAARAPSSGNLQPWHAYIIDGEAMAALKITMGRKVIENPEGEAMPSPFYPDPLMPVQTQRRKRNGEILYAALGIDRDDSEARRAWNLLNFQFFGAPAGIFLFLDRNSTPFQWLDLGIYLQSLLLLLEESGISACPQADWALYGETVRDLLGVGPNRMLICGVAIGYADPTRPENFIRTERVDPLALQ